MRKLFFLLLFILAAVGASARQDTLKYRISLKDKAATTYSLEHPEAFLSEKAIERRRKQNLPIDSTDLPVCRKYVDEIRRQGVKIVVTGKWENFVTVSCNDSALVERIAALPFVRETEKVWIAPGGDGPFMATEFSFNCSFVVFAISSRFWSSGGKDNKSFSFIMVSSSLLPSVVRKARLPYT